VIVSLFDRYNFVLKRLQKCDEIKEIEIKRDLILSLLDYLIEISKNILLKSRVVAKKIFSMKVK